MEIRKEIKWFAECMEKVLRKNDDKGGWEQEGTEYLIDQMKDNFIQLERLPTNRIIIKCCVDIANYAMMIADNEKNGR